MKRGASTGSPVGTGAQLLRHFLLHGHICRESGSEEEQLRLELIPMWGAVGGGLTYCATMPGLQMILG